jgi:hypothetical protein
MSHLHYEQEIFDTTVTGGAPAVLSSVFEPKEGLLPEKIGLWIALVLANPGNVITIVATWAGDDGTTFLPSLNNSSQTVTTNVVLTLCNPGGAKSLQLEISSAGMGDDQLSVIAKTNLED